MALSSTLATLAATAVWGVLPTNSIVYVRSGCALRGLNVSNGSHVRAVPTACGGARVGAIANGMVFTGNDALAP
jgi:hypothetical protein